MSRENSFYVETAPAETRRPPIVEIGAIGWIRGNLFRSWLDSLLTAFSVLLIIWAIIGFINWAVGQANWAVITNNLHLFAVGTYPQDQAWRPLLSTVILMFLLGLTWRLWGRATRILVILTIVGVALLLVFPAVASTLPFANTNLLIGGPTTDPIPAQAYVAQEGETVNFTLAPITDFATEAPKGFMDRASLTVAGLGRQEAQARQFTVDQAIEAGASLPEAIPGGAFVSYEEGEFTVLAPDLVATVTISQVLYETSTNEESGEVEFVQGEIRTLETLAAGPGQEAASLAFTFPEAGWYLFVLEREGDVGGFWLEADYFTPLGGSSALTNEREAQHGPTPALEDTWVKLLDTTNIPFRGISSLSDFVKLHLGPVSEGLSLFTVIMVIATAAGYGLGVMIKDQLWSKRLAFIGWSVLSLLIFVLLLGISGPGGILPIIDMERWGGLLLTMALTVVGIVVAFPIGVLLALGRRSDLPVVRIFCTLSIELVRGVPLVTILFAASILVPLVDPSLSGVDNVIRAMIGMTFFSAVYLAEIVRGGLQAVPYGQEEAAKALGMSPWQAMLLIVLPQALRTVIPALMGQFVSLFKDTSLVLIIGLIDLLGISRSVINQAEYIGLQRETLVFISVIYFVLSYLMSWASRRLEGTGSGGFQRR